MTEHEDRMRGRQTAALERIADAAELQALTAVRAAGLMGASPRDVERMTLLKSRMTDGERDPE